MINDIRKNHNLSLKEYVIKYYGNDDTKSIMDFVHQITIRHYDIVISENDDNLRLEHWD
jgi:hypothetical protein